MTKRPLVLLDADDVLADYTGAYLETLSQLTGKHREREEVRSWDIAASLGLSQDEIKQMREATHSPNWCLSIPVLPKAREGLCDLRTVADVHVVTAPKASRYWAGERLEWLQHHFDIPADDVTQTRAKHLVRGDAIVDDSLENVAKWAEANRDGVALLWNTPHNRLDVFTNRITGWDDLLAVVKRVIEHPYRIDYPCQFGCNDYEVTRGHRESCPIGVPRI